MPEANHNCCRIGVFTSCNTESQCVVSFQGHPSTVDLCQGHLKDIWRATQGHQEWHFEDCEWLKMRRSFCGLVLSIMPSGVAIGGGFWRWLIEVCFGLYFAFNCLFSERNTLKWKRSWSGIIKCQEVTTGKWLSVTIGSVRKCQWEVLGSVNGKWEIHKSQMQCPDETVLSTYAPVVGHHLSIICWCHWCNRDMWLVAEDRQMMGPGHRRQLQLKDFLSCSVNSTVSWQLEVTRSLAWPLGLCAPHTFFPFPISPLIWCQAQLNKTEGNHAGWISSPHKSWHQQPIIIIVLGLYCSVVGL